jgi:O-succinylbenzoate synthase
VDLTHVELRRLSMPLVSPFRASHGTETVRDVLLLRALGPDVEGWGECVAMSAPTYTEEWVGGAHEVIRRFLVPLLHPHDLRADDIPGLLSPVQGHRMAKAAVEAAVLDAELRAAGTSLAAHLGSTRATVPSGVAVGMQSTIEATIAAVAAQVEAGYRRVKLKIARGWDIEPVAAVREAFSDLLLQVDANSAYTLADAGHLAGLDAFGLLLIEQPLAADDLDGHAELARRLDTPLCLDESITSLRTALDAIGRGACGVINVKPGRVGGLAEAVRIHDACVEHGVGLWCGGMLETGIGRAMNVALASLPGFTLPGDLSASARWFDPDLITEPFVLDDGHLRVPTGPGIGVEPDPASLHRFTASSELVTLG